MTFPQQIITIGLCVLGTMSTRFRHAGRLLSSQCGHLVRNAWTAGRHLHPYNLRTAPLEKADAPFHRRRHRLLHAASALLLTFDAVRAASLGPIAALVRPGTKASPGAKPNPMASAGAKTK